MNPRKDETREWLKKAKSDLMAAKILVKHGPPVLDAACFHCQQVVEKALKAFLVWEGVPFEKVHSLVYLLDLCEEKEPGFASMRERAEALAPYAVEVRYPGGVMETSKQEVASRWWGEEEKVGLTAFGPWESGERRWRQ